MERLQESKSLCLWSNQKKKGKKHLYVYSWENVIVKAVMTNLKQESVAKNFSNIFLLQVSHFCFDNKFSLTVVYEKMNMHPMESGIPLCFAPTFPSFYFFFCLAPFYPWDMLIYLLNTRIMLCLSNFHFKVKF